MIKEKQLLEAFMIFMSDFQKETIEKAKRELIKELENERLKTKLFYSLKEVEQITGISKGALKGRIKRKSLNAVYDSTTILIAQSELDRLIQKLNKQLKWT